MRSAKASTAENMVKESKDLRLGYHIQGHWQQWLRYALQRPPQT